MISTKKNLEEQLFWVYLSAGEMFYASSTKNAISSLSSNTWPKSFYLELVPGRINFYLKTVYF